VVARLALCVGLALHPGLVVQANPEMSDAQPRVEVVGAVRHPGSVALTSAGMNADEALAQVGGADADAYRFANLLLRRTAEAAPRFPCVAPGARHAALLMADDAALKGQTELTAGLLDGRIQRLAMHDRPFGRLGSDRAAVMLRAGDILVVPRRSGRVYIVYADGATESLEHRAELTAGDYLDQVPRQRLARLGEYLLHYPDGSAVGLALEAWNAEPMVVPPGSMLAPAAGCLPAPG
jgi:hypothetical protein